MRVLVIENDSDFARLLCRGLEAEYYAVDVSLNKNSGIKMAETDEYDIIILNTIDPHSECENVIKSLRSHNITSPIIIITEKRSVQSKVDMFNCGCDDYLLKPFHFEELSARIRAILRRRGVSQKDIIEIGELYLDSISHEVRYRGEDIDLRNREFDLLEYLMRNEGRVVTRNMVLEHVWDINADTFSNTIEVHVTHLRKKLGDAGEMIKTIRGVGYKLVICE